MAISEIEILSHTLPEIPEHERNATQTLTDEVFLIRKRILHRDFPWFFNSGHSIQFSQTVDNA